MKIDYLNYGQVLHLLRYSRTESIHDMLNKRENIKTYRTRIIFKNVSLTEKY